MAKKVYFIGIKGVGMTSLAIAMQDAGWEVKGSDTDEIFITDEILKSRDITVEKLSDIPSDQDLIVYSAAYEPPQSKIRAVPLAVALAEFVADRRVIAIAGVGGKTTTSAMLATLMQQAGRDVGYYIGTSNIIGLETPGHNGTDPYFVVEADEYAISKSDKRAKFALLTPEILITTNIIHDHPDIYPDEQATIKAFQALISRLPEHASWICNADDRLTTILRKSKYKCQVIPYSMSDQAINELELSVFGKHNQLDAYAALLASGVAGVTREAGLAALKAYKGAKRRQEPYGEMVGRLLYDDYGHHPEEIEVTLEAFRQAFPGKRIILIFESHTYTRTEALLDDFAKSIALADVPILMPIFESAREKGAKHALTAPKFEESVKKYNKSALSVSWQNAASKIADISRPGDLILTMGAGFVYKLHVDIKKILENKKDD